MRLAMIARCNSKGLGTMTWEFFRHMEPAKTLVVRWPADEWDPQRFPGARVCEHTRDGNLPDEAIDWLLSDVDVLYTAETPYDFRVLDLARQRGVATAVHGMWEFLRWRLDRDDGTRQLPRPNLFLAPSPWCLEEWPAPVVHLPVPVAVDRFEPREVRHVRTVVHPGGSPAMGDRNGTLAVMAAIPLLRSRVHVVVKSMGYVRRPRRASAASYTIEASTAHRYWDVMGDADAVVLPRRYGGLCLPLQEATATGLPVIALSREHETGYDHAAVVREAGRAPMRLPCGNVERSEVDALSLARAIDHLVEEGETAAQMSERSLTLRRAWSWEALRATYSDVLGSLAR